MTQEERTQHLKGQKFSIRLELQHVSLRREKGEYKLENLTGRLFVENER